MVASIFKRGFQARAEVEKTTKKGGYIKDYFLTARDNPDAPVRFLTDEPISFWSHNVQEGGRYNNYACTCEPDCPLCQAGAPRSFKSAYLVVDGRQGSYISKKTGEKVEFDKAVAVLLRGNDCGIIERNRQRYGLLDAPYYATRMGQKPSISYLFDKAGAEIFEKYPYLDKDIFAIGELNEAAKEKIQELLPDKYRGLDYYEIIEKKFPFYGVEDTSFDTATVLEEPEPIRPAGLNRVLVREVD